jgi:glycosyltransferase involved in cell wall biosynthesis
MPIINEINPDIIHLHEVPEFFMKEEIAVDLFNNPTRNYFIVTTTHSSLTTPAALKFYPDKFVLVSEWSRQKFQEQLPEIPNDIWEYPVEKYFKDKKLAQELLGLDPEYKHVLNVGLFTPGKNQGEIFEIAKGLKDKKIKFHFVGNQAGNFQEYWEPLMKDKPENCIVWGERNDVHNFYQACDVFYFSSKFELNPLSIKEALSYEMPCLFRRLETYLDTYDNNPLVTYIDNNLERTKHLLLR